MVAGSLGVYSQAILPAPSRWNQTTGDGESGAGQMTVPRLEAEDQEPGYGEEPLYRGK